jgi:hypothetical protein
MRRKIEITSDEDVAKVDVNQVVVPVSPLRFSREQRHMLRKLWADYPARRDFLDASELPHLQFIRWLHRTGRLSP